MSVPSVSRGKRKERVVSGGKLVGGTQAEIKGSD
ncbi:hypothetical protein CCACVL1_20105 [Corchorus capsularis]|uniref:Uncharacterized protein n=1 Tax=Corchorus capsularis TaxID=210143 RepID=A0A1R3HCF9_COCAP|nr:hypothetical protein CCACVL1_20105 [Corchorus capsularis]